MSKAVTLTDRQKRALRPFVQAARNLDYDGMLASDARMRPGVYLDSHEWRALLNEFDAAIPAPGNNL